jgi:hypothetical protein
MSEFWLRVHRFLFCWVHCGPSSWWWFKGREEVYVVLRFGVLVLLALLAVCGHSWIWIAIIGAALLAIDILLFNTAVVFETGGLGDPLRSIVLTLIAYVSLAVAFVPAWIWLSFHDGSNRERIASGFYQSIRTLTTAGPEGVSCAGERMLASFEMVTGIYFLSIILAGYLSWLNGGLPK